MAYLIDTTILGRLANVRDTQHAVAARAVLELHRRGEVLHVTPQVMVEFRNVATRPAAVNGLGLSAVDAEVQAATFEVRVPSTRGDTGHLPGLEGGWWATLSVIGKQVHDARLAAVCHIHGVTHVMTFNVSHFGRLSSFGPGFVVVDPASI